MRIRPRAPRNRYGQALVEYALTIALVGVGLTFALLTLRNSVGNTVNGTSNQIAQSTSCSYAGTATGCTATGPDAGGGSAGGGSGNNGGGNGNGNNGNGNGNGGGNGSNGGGNGNGNNGNGSGNGGGRK
jgi:Flp pilus assembly pilin Flp